MKNKTSEEILDDFTLEVKKIEEEAEQIIEDAKRKKEQIIADAKTDSVKLIAKKQAELEKKKEENTAKGKKKIDEKKEEIMKKGKSDIRDFEGKSRKNIAKATEFVVKKLNQKIEEL